MRNAGNWSRVAIWLMAFAVAQGIVLVAASSGFALDDETRNTTDAKIEPPRAPAEMLVPDVTKSFVSFPDFAALQAAFKKTQFGMLAEAEVMQPFIKDLDRQIDEKLAQTGARLGVSWADVRDVYGGEICLASIQPPGEKPTENYALALLVDVVGKDAAVGALLTKISNNMAARNATKSAQTIGGIEVTVYELPKKLRQRRGSKSFVVVHKKWLLAVDNEAMAEDILSRIDNQAKAGSLAAFVPFQEVMQRSAQVAGDAPAHIRCFVEPFGIAEVAQAAKRAGRRSRSKKGGRMAAAKKQGFSAVEGIGGRISFAFGGEDVLYHMAVHCPAAKRVAAAKMLDFPNAGGNPFAWTPKTPGSHLIVNWKLLQAFRAIEPLANELLGDDVWQEIILSIEKDRNGPQINLEKDLVAHMQDRVVMMTDIQLPVTVDSERVCAAIPLKNGKAVALSVKKAFQNDPHARPILHNGKTIYEIRDPESEDRVLNNISIVVHDNDVLLIASHSDYLKTLMDRKGDNAFVATDEYTTVEAALKKLGANGDAMRGFTNLKLSAQVNYELMRQNKLPESKSMLGQMLNSLWPTDDKAVQREAKIDGSKLPAFKEVSKYFKTGGFYVRSDAKGWIVIGCVQP